MSDVVVRELSTVAECAAITPLTWQVWGPNAPVFSVDLLRAIGHTGGYLAGAFLDAGAGGQEAGAGEQEMVGFSLGLLADLNGARSLHSHATGVLAHARGLHVGLALKEHQRAWAHSRQILTVTWTFDPLVRRNATFNLLRLGARAAEYLEDFYGLLDDDLNGPLDILPEETDKRTDYRRPFGEEPRQSLGQILTKFARRARRCEPENQHAREVPFDNDSLNLAIA